MNKSNIPVIVEVESTQTFPETGSDTIKMQCFGTFELLDSGFLLAYKEENEEGLQGVSTTLHGKNDSISMLRTGDCHWEVRFSKGHCHESDYHTAYGKMETEVTTEKIEENFSKEGGTLFLEYTLKIQGGSKGKVIFNLKVTPTQS